MVSSLQPRIKALKILEIFANILLIACVKAEGIPEKALNIKRSDFPNDFLFGVATSAQQVEGAGNEGGRTPSVWDQYIENFPGKIRDQSNSLAAIDSYKRYKEDVKIIKDLGVNSYRLSISWSRILPQGSLNGGINQEGINYYNNLINELIENGIRPFVTILHFDTPQALEDEYGGFLSRSIVKDFTDYCEILFRTYGDRVKDWITINEPFVVALGYDIGNAAPGRCSLPPPLGPCPAGNSSTEPYIVAHNFILSHASAVKLYKEKFQAEQGGQIGITLLTEFSVPYDPNSLEDKEASERYMNFLLGWFMEPFVYGRYPGIMSELVKERLPTFSEEDKKLIQGAYDFIGINYYTSKYAKKPNHPPFLLHYVADQLVNSTHFKDGVPIGPKSEGSGYVYSYPQGLQELLEFMKRKYHNPPIYITENGIPEETVPDRTLDEALTDPYRIKFILQHLYYIKAALMNGVNVKGYFYWSVFDNFEWNGGYAVRYGLYYIDYKDNLKRIPKQSAKWFGGFLNGHTSTAPSQCTLHHKIDL